jgi:uracil phosphoribosyltransferase
MSLVREVEHSLIRCHVTRLRDKHTAPEEFRRLLRRTATLLAYEATRDLAVDEESVETPLALTAGFRLRERIGLVPILRAGLGMLDPVLDLIPDAEVWHLGVYRDETSFRPVEYYRKFPKTHPVDAALVLDPMLATGGSAIAALATLEEWGVKRIKIVSVIAASAGVRAVEERFPRVQIYVGAIDPALSDRAFIVPGLGDAGDRFFNTRAEGE